MKKFFLCMLIVLLSCSFLFSQEYDIRKLKWGMTYSQVQSAEGLTNEFYKLEDILGAKVEVVFSIGKKGLYSVTYSTRTDEFHAKAQGVLVKKYGEPTEDLDYPFLVQQQHILKEYPGITLKYMKKPDLALLQPVKTKEAKIVIRMGLAKRELWKYPNSVALLIGSLDGVVLSYHSTAHYEESKKKFKTLLTTLKQLAEKPKKKEAEDVEKL